MFGLFKKKPKEPTTPQISDINGEALAEGDLVISQRYDLGECKIVLEGIHFYYQSVESGEKVSFTKMVDAITGFQKVVKK